MRHNTIRQFVWEQLANGVKPDAVWLAARQKFSDRIVVRGYILGIVREFRCARAPAMSTPLYSASEIELLKQQRTQALAAAREVVAKKGRTVHLRIVKP